MSNTNCFNNKTALVTGASGGIGRAICCKLAARGMKIYITGRNPEKLRDTASLIGNTVIITGDITDLDFHKTIAEQISTDCGTLDVLVNCAGLAQNSPFEEITPDLYDAVMNANVRAPYFLTQKMLPLLRGSDCATIINICSVLAHKGYPFQSVYTASKHALIGWSKSLANEVLQDNIRIHVISPGGVFTEMVRVSRPDLKPDGMTLPEDIAEIADFYLSMRMKNAVIDEIQIHRPAKEPFA